MLLASCATEIKFHKWPSGDFCGSFEVPGYSFYTPSFSWCNEGDFLVTTAPSMSSPIILSVKETTIKTYETVEVMGEIQAAAFSRATQKKIAFGAENGRMLLYDFSSRPKVQELPRLPAGIKYLEYGAGDTTLVAGCKNGEIFLYNSKNSVVSTFYVPNTNSLTAIACHSSLPYILAASSREGVVAVWDSSTGNALLVHNAHTHIITDVALSPGDEIATVGLDQKLIGYDIRSHESIYSCLAEEELSAVKFMPTGDKIAVATANGKLYCFDKRRIDHPIHTIVAHHTKPIGKIGFQNVPSCDNSTSNETLTTQQPESAKSNVTTMIYNSYCRSKHTTVVQEFAGIASQVPSSANTTSQEPPELEWQAPSATSDYIAAYLDVLQVNRNPNPCRGDGSSTKVIVGSSVRSTISSEEVGATVVPSSTTNQHVDFNIIPGPINILHKFLAAPNNPKGDATNKPVLTEVGEVDKNSVSNLAVSVEEMDELVKLKIELQEAIRRLGEDLVDLIHKEFLKVRMAVSRGFVQLESKMDLRLSEFQMILMKLAMYEEPLLDELEDKRSPQEHDDNIVRHQPTSSRIPTRNLINRSN